MRTRDFKLPLRYGLGALALAALMGCVPTSPALTGLTGITVNAEGRLTLVVAWCQQPPDRVVVYQRVNDRLEDQAELKAPKLSGSPVFLDLEKIPLGWSLVEGDLNFQPGRKYVASAYNAKKPGGTFRVSFTTAYKTKPTAGRILVQDHSGEQPDGVDVPLSSAEFVARAKHYC
ncbi:hypothetical protein [Nonomuraea wenchangensis]|uniref:Lipoprotein n=1 Tax=Nonomuraea wenchangensis TaxID=568860 RepID=A0A1I0KPJ9_9ACTN|nr:hypothetical protein [Nonomuraea wenchangensis]SEU27537.1 hypothetical protein SAMN05421811_10937 [Nonomuraea wenchangensis]